MTPYRTIRITLDATPATLDKCWNVRGSLEGNHFEVIVTEKEIKKAGWLGIFSIALAALLRDSKLGALTKSEAEAILKDGGINVKNAEKESV